MKLLSRLEEIILLSIWKLQDNAYGMTIREEVIKATGTPLLLGAIYGPLSRLLRNGYITSIKGYPTPERGGRSKVFYHVTPEGQEALLKIQKVNSVIRTNIPPLTIE